MHLATKNKSGKGQRRGRRKRTPFKAEASIASGPYSMVMLTLSVEPTDMMFTMAPRPLD
jgi:hypothetical protein